MGFMDVLAFVVGVAFFGLLIWQLIRPEKF
jgi:hypothetical protein